MIQTTQPMQIHFHNTVQSSLHAHKCLHFPNMKQAALIKGYIRMRQIQITLSVTQFTLKLNCMKMPPLGKWWDVSVLFSLYLILNLYVTHTLQAGQTAWACTALEMAHAGCVSSCLTKKTHRCGADMCAGRLKPSQSDRLVMIKRGQMHNREIIRTRPLCMNPSTSTQLCQTAWSIIFSNSCGLESDYWAPSVAQTSVAKQVTSWLFTVHWKIHPVS